MTPSRAATVFRELLQTSDGELSLFARRAGLHGELGAEDLLRARELLQAVAAALESGREQDWTAIRAAWEGLRSKRSPVGVASPPVTTGEASRPAMLGRQVAAKPSLSDSAPGASADQQDRRKFVPVARPRHVAAPQGADPAAQPPPAASPPPGAAFTSPRAPSPATEPAADDGSTPFWAGGALPAQPVLMSTGHQTPTGDAAFTAARPAAAPPAPAAPVAAAPQVPAAPPAAAAPAQPPAAPAAPPPTPPPAGAQSAPSPTPQAEGAGGEAKVHDSVAAYASLCATCAEFPDQVADTLAGYGLSGPEQRAELDELWQDRFDDDPELLVRWEQLLSHFRSTLQRRR